jgi:hypothetical protein
LPRTSLRYTNLGHPPSNRTAAGRPARSWTLRKSDRGGIASTSNFTGQMALRSSDRGGTASTKNFTESLAENSGVRHPRGPVRG